jgi:iron complex transport system substrate-binding protein
MPKANFAKRGTMKKINQQIFFSFIIFFTCEVIAFSSQAQQLQRIVSLSPNITEILFELKLDDEIVGVTDFCNYPPPAKTKPRVGGYMNLNLETILSLQPTVVIMLSYNQSLKKKFDALHIKSLSVKNETIQDIQDAILKIGMATGRKNEAQKLSTTIGSKLHRYRQMTTTLKRKPLLFIIGRNPGTLEEIYAVGGKSFLNELIASAGGENILSSVMIQYPKISQEEIAARNPEIIIEASPFTKPNPDQLNKHRQAWAQLPFLNAVKNNQIYFLEQDFLLIPGPRISQTLDLLLQILHPDISEKLGDAHE